VALALLAGVGAFAWLALGSPHGAPDATPSAAALRRADRAAVTSSPTAGGREVVAQVAGAVAAPGLVRLRDGLRVADAIAAAGGARPDADLDAVNLAARLEGANKAFGTLTMASEATRAACGPGLAFRPLARLRVKGRGEPVAVHELVAAGAEPEWVEPFRSALGALDRGDASSARERFAEVLALRPGDEPSRRWLARLDGPGHGSVDPVWTLDEK